MHAKRFLASVLGGFGLSAVCLGGLFGTGLVNGRGAPEWLNFLLGMSLYAAGSSLGLYVLDRLNDRQK